MTLLFDERAKIGNAPGMHVLLAGVSLYPHLPKGGGPAAPQNFGMGQLKSPALTAYRLYQWLVKRKDHLPVPLATCRVLLSPSPEEIAVESALAKSAGPCTWQAFAEEVEDWRDDAAQSSQSHTLFYFGGHGVQRTQRDTIMLMADFGVGPGGTLTKGAAINNIHDAMAPSARWPNIARTQFYFVDACRTQPEAFKHTETLNVPDIMDVVTGAVDNRCAPVFYASVAGAYAYALDGKETLFGLALSDALAWRAAVLHEDNVRWVVTSHSLDHALKARLAELNKEFNVDQDSTLGGIAGKADIHFLDGPPLVDVAIRIDPENALPWTTVQIEDAASNQPACKLPAPLPFHPYAQKLSSGYYRVRASIVPPTPPYLDAKPKVYPVTPLNRELKVKLEP